MLGWPYIEDNIERVSTFAGSIDGVISFIGWVVWPWFIACSVLFFYLILKNRDPKGERRAAYITGKKKEEKRWITIPHGLVLLLDVFVIIAAVRVWYDVKQDIPEPDLEIRVTAQQWAWIFTHPGLDGQLDTDDDVRIVDELHVEAGKVYNFHLESRDVMHNFSVPVFRLKQDAVPGRTITGWFEATMPGPSYDPEEGYLIQCAEMCGIGHGAMPARLFIETSEQHAAWLLGETSVASLDLE